MTHCISILGGSTSFTAALVDAVAQPARGPRALVLIGRSERDLMAVVTYAHHRLEHLGWTIDASTDMVAGLVGADVVIHQIPDGDMAGRQADEALALTVGVPPDETLGPAGLASALRLGAPLAETCRVLRARLSRRLGVEPHESALCGHRPHARTWRAPLCWPVRAPPGDRHQGGGAPGDTRDRLELTGPEPPWIHHPPRVGSSQPHRRDRAPVGQRVHRRHRSPDHRIVGCAPDVLFPPAEPCCGPAERPRRVPHRAQA